MIVLKATQDKVLAVLQSVAGIVERRHTLPILDKVVIRRSDFNCSTAKASASKGYQPAESKPARQRSLSLVLRCIGFFSSSKANLRNAP